MEAAALVAWYSCRNRVCHTAGHSQIVDWISFNAQRRAFRGQWSGHAQRDYRCLFFDAPEKRREFVTAATSLTHTDPRALTAALAVAETAALAVRQDEPIDDWLTALPRLSRDDEWRVLCRKLANALAVRTSVQAFAESLGLQNAVTGYAYHSVPVALYAWVRHRSDFRVAMESALNCGGDTDSVGAIVGALAGTDVAGRPLGPVRYFWPGMIPRNFIFLVAVLLHGFRRLLP